MKWLILSSQAPGVVRCDLSRPAMSRTRRSGPAIVAAYTMIASLMDRKPGALRVRAIVDEFLPQIAARFA